MTASPQTQPAPRLRIAAICAIVALALGAGPVADIPAADAEANAAAGPSQAQGGDAQAASKDESSADNSADAAPRRPTPRQLVGIDVVDARLGEAAPTGRGVVIGHVESGGQQGGRYTPNTKNSRYEGVSFTMLSGVGKVSGHADATARLMYGAGGLAPGVTNVNVFEATHWLRSALFLPAEVADESGRQVPAEQFVEPFDCRVTTNSWIHSGGPMDPLVLQRVDYLIDKHDVIVVAGVNNGGATPVPHLLGSAYNGIAVGIAGRASSSGYTRLEQPGRCKPDVVVAMSKTSFSTPVVAAVVARLLEAADGIAAEAGDSPGAIGAHANKAEVIKAVLMAGADKAVGFEPQEGRPLDQHHGAGAARFDRSLDALTAGPVAPGKAGDSKDRPRGWSFGESENIGGAEYWLEVTRPLAELSVILTWHRRVGPAVVETESDEETRRSWVTKTSLADFNLGLINDTGDILARSTSKVDNVEHVYLRGLKPGKYRITIGRRDNDRRTWQYAVAWWGRLATPAESGGAGE